MISEIFQKIEENKISLNAKILCAVSGGIDSIVMLNILNDYKFDCIVAHCNFKLRGKESDGDEEFVRNVAKKFEMKFVNEIFDTVAYSEKMGISIQMAARDLRYEWFYQMAEKYNCNYIALAHNSDDQAETIITNLIRGTGIRGLTGMQLIKDKLFRPLLYTSRKEIEEFAVNNEIFFRIDSTNATTKYSRNKIRLSIFPLMEEINSSYKRNILKSVSYLKDTEQIMQAYVSQAKEECLSYRGDRIFINVEKLKRFVSINTVLFEILVSEGIPKPLAVEALNLLKAQSGKYFSLFNIDILRDRECIIIKKDVKQNIFNNIDFEEDKIYNLEKYEIKVQIINNSTDFKINKSKNFAYINYGKLKFPLKLRNWQEGDKFRPFGMHNMKKLSDFFSDEKLSAFDKSEILLLTSGKDIVWVIGHRIDDRYKIDSNTEKVLILEKI